MKGKLFRERLGASAYDFIEGVQPLLEKRLGITVHPIEDLKSSELMVSLDQRGIDAFYYDSRGDMRGLASRMNYSRYAASRPAFTFRYKLWDPTRSRWDDDREYARKLRAATAPEEFVLFPKMHVESYAPSPRSGTIGWSFAAETKTIVSYIRDNLENPERVRIFTPSGGERRQVITVPIEVFAKIHPVTEVAH